MSIIELQIVSPWADNAYSGKTVAADTYNPRVIVRRRNPVPYYYPRIDGSVADVVQGTFRRRRFDVSGGQTVEVLCDEEASFKDVVEHLLARDREFRRLEDKYSLELERWRRLERADAAPLPPWSPVMAQ